MPKQSSSEQSIYTNIHDRFFYDIFHRIDYLFSLMQASLSSELFDIFKWSTLRIESPVAHADEHDRIQADLVFSVALKGNEGKARVILLFEHKSYQSGNLLKQMARNLFMRHIDDDFNSIIVPIVVRQYKLKHAKPIEFSDLFGEVAQSQLKMLNTYALNFKCLLIDLHRLDGEGRVAGTNIDLAVRAMSIVRNFDKRRWLDLMDRLVSVSNEDKQWLFNLVIRYITSYNKIEADQVLRIETRTSEEKQMVLSAVETFREEGVQVGLEKGLKQGSEQARHEIASNLLQEGVALKKVAALTHLSPEQVKSIEQKINGASKD